METTDAEHPPPFQPTNEIELVSKEHSKITGVSGYSGRAEFDVQTGQNQVTVTGLPNVLDQDSLRVEGHGAATIHNVTISSTPRPTPPTTSPGLTVLQSRKAKTLKALERCKKSITALESYFATMHSQHINVMQVGKVMKEYEATAGELDGRVLDLEKELSDVEAEIAEERTKLGGKALEDHLGIQVAIGVFAEVEGEVEIALIYAVYGASWNAGYDIRVDMKAKEEQVMLIYKAAITQSTGEDWNDVSLTLETATPTFGVSVPTLDPWNLSISKPAPPIRAPPPAPVPISPPGMVYLSASANFVESEQSAPPLPRVIPHSTLAISSKGNVSATFEVPGLITIPSDGVAHNVTIVQLKLNATMSWVCVPKKDTKTHLSAKIKNASQYTLLSGTGSVYVDGSFISRSKVPAVSPDESFNCALGLDPSIRITYHPQTKKQSKSGFYTKTTTHVLSQHITVFNTKTSPIDGVRILDHIPVSEDARIQVNLINPPLTRPSVSSGSSSVGPSSSALEGARKPVAVGKGDVDVDGERVGRDGKVGWGKVNLLLQWEVVVPARTDVVGMMLAVCYS
ncbi:hypothetical protein FPV67DRAFT_1611316 [Lyophyllum atratum]|nr:hypothetical protein FPV67DRAFT_1611316 [Lyophyllum atratum]